MENRLNISPMDEHNIHLLSNVHPTGWENPSPAEMYNLVVIGGGSAGMVCAAGAAGLGARVALIENRFLGGDCLNFGCVPSKALIRSSRIVGEIKRAGEHGINISGMEIDFTSVMERVRRLRSEISGHDSAARYRELGIDVFLGDVQFTAPNMLMLENIRIPFKKAVIATGSRPVKPDTEGLADAGFLTNETVFSLTDIPKRLAVIGGGPIGCELAQAFSRLGSKVTIIHRHSYLLPKDDFDVAELLAETFSSEGIDVRFDTHVKKVSVHEDDKIIHLAKNGKEESVSVDEILTGAGRKANVEGMNLEYAGVEYSERGVAVNDYMQTTNKNIYAAGDVCMRYKFTHAADHAARIVLQNALFMGRKKLSSIVIPWCTYTDPEIAHVGISEREAEMEGMKIDTFKKSFTEVDRAIVDGELDGFVKIHLRKGSDKIIGATIAASHAGEMISQITSAIVNRISLKKLGKVVYPYPTQTEAIRHIADAYNRTRLTERAKKIFNMWFTWQRK